MRMRVRMKMMLSFFGEMLNFFQENLWVLMGFGLGNRVKWNQDFEVDDGGFSK